LYLSNLVGIITEILSNNIVFLSVSRHMLEQLLKIGHAYLPHLYLLTIYGHSSIPFNILSTLQLKQQLQIT